MLQGSFTSPHDSSGAENRTQHHSDGRAIELTTGELRGKGDNLESVDGWIVAASVNWCTKSQAKKD